MNRIVTRLRTMFVHAPFGFTATFPTEDAYPARTPVRVGRPNTRRPPVIPRRLADRVIAHRSDAVPEPSLDQPSPETSLWSWQDQEGIDEPLAYSR